MSVVKLILILIFLKLNFFRLQSKETTCLINGKKSLNVVNERFLSFSIDPATLLNGFNGSSTSIKLAQHLSPAFIRIAGPSTQFMQLSEDGKTPLFFFGNTIRFEITPAMWESLNNWINDANLMPIFAINNKNTLKGAWHPKSLVPLLNVNEENNFTCYWQLGYDCKHKSLYQYKEDLIKLKLALDAYHSTRQISKIVGSNLEPCVSNKNPEFARESLEDLHSVVDAVMWEQDSTDGNFVGNIFKGSLIPVWLIVPKATQPVTFSSGLLWAKQIGEAAQAGYDVVFRQPRFYELFTDTPVYWVSLIYKTFMGRNVLEVRSNSSPDSNINIYAHCTKKQGNYSKQGAITVFVINNSSTEHTTSLRVSNSYPRSIEVQSYILTSDGDDSTNIYLNGEILSIDNLGNEQCQFTPKTRRTRVNTVLNLISPAKSVGFFVLPGARVSVCTGREDDKKFLKKFQLNQDVDPLPSSNEDLPVQIPQEYKNKLYRLMPQKIEENEDFDQETINMLKKPFPTLGKLKEKNNFTLRGQQAKAFRQQLITRAQAMGTKENGEKTAKLEIIFKERPGEHQAPSNNVKTIEVELTNEEMKKILQDRAKSSIAEENIDITSRELEDILREAAKNTLDNEYTTMAALNKRKRFAVFDFLRRTNDKARVKANNHRRRTKRGINMELLSRRTMNSKPPKTFRDNQDLQATIRRQGETSEEFLRDETSTEKVRDVYAQLANSWENPDSKFQVYESFDRRRIPVSTNINRLSGKASEEGRCAKYVDDRVTFMKEPEELDSFLEDDLNSYYGIHENFKEFKANHRPNYDSEVQKLGAFTQGRDGKRDLPSVKLANVELWEADKLPQEQKDEKVELAPHKAEEPRIQRNKWETRTLIQKNNERAGDLMSFNSGKHKHNEEMNKWVSLPDNNARRIEDPLSYEIKMVNPQMIKTRRTDTFSLEKYGDESSLNSEELGKTLAAQGSQTETENPTCFRMANSQINNVNPQSNTFPEISAVKKPTSKTIRPQIKKESSESDPFYQKSKLELGSVSSFPIITAKSDSEVQKTAILSLINNAILSSIKKEGIASRNKIWETPEVAQDNIQKPENSSSFAAAKFLSNEIPKLDYSKTENKNEEHLVKTVTPQINEDVWGFNAVSQENVEKIPNSSSFTTAHIPINDETLKTNNVSSENDKEVHLFSRISNISSNEEYNKLNDYFCDPKNSFALETYPSNRYKPKYKRDVSNITRNDIRNYKKFMMDQLRLMRKARNNNGPQPEKISRVPLKELIPRSRSKFAPTADFEHDNLSSEEMVHLMAEASQEQENPRIGESTLAKKLEKFRQNRKTLFEKIKERKSQQLEDVENDLANLRHKRTPHNIKLNKVHSENAVVKQYKPKIVRRREWKPQDIVKVKKVPSHSVEVVDNRQFLHRAAPFVKSKFKKIKRHTRSVRAYAHSIPNTIDDFSSRRFETFSKLLRDAQNESLSKHFNYNVVNVLNKRNSSQDRILAVAAHANEIIPVISTKTSETTTSNSSVEAVTTCRTRNEEVTPNTTEKVGATLDERTKNSSGIFNREASVKTAEAEESSLIPPNLVDMIMGAVNSTVTKFVHLGEQIAKQFSF